MDDRDDNPSQERAPLPGQLALPLDGFELPACGPPAAAVTSGDTDCP